MSKSKDRQGESAARPLASDRPNPAPPARPLKPRPMLFIVMAIALIAIFFALLAIYFKTVYPYRLKAHPVETDSAAAIGAADVWRPGASLCPNAPLKSQA